MQWLKQSTAVKPIVGPFVAATDGVTPVTFISSDADAFLLVKHGSTVTFALDSDALVVTSDATAFANLTLGATDVDTLGMLQFIAQDASLCLPVISRFMVVSAGAYGAMVTGTDSFRADVSAIPTTNLDSSDVQAELVTYDALKGTEGAWASDIAALNDLASSDIQAELVTYDAATGAEIAAVPTTNLDSSDIVASLTTYGASTHAASDVSAGAVATSDIWDVASSDWTGAGTFGQYLDQQISTLSLSFASSDIDAIWDEKSSDHVTAGTFGLYLDAQASGIPTTNLDSSDIQAELVIYDAATGTELAALNDLASSDVQAELVTYDAATGAEIAAVPTTNLDSSDIAAQLTNVALTSDVLQAQTLINALNDLSDTDVLGYTLETGYTVAQALRLIASATAGKVSGGGTATLVFRDLADAANRITATVDTDGNRTAMTLNP